MQNFIADSRDFSGSTVTLRGEEHHHATRSSRVRPGEIIGVTDGHGRRVMARIRAIDSKTLTAAVERDLSSEGEPPVKITIALALIKPARFETAVEKCTELGARRFMPLITNRTMVKPDTIKIDRLERIIREAVKQSGRSWIPEISGPIGLETLVKDSPGPVLAAVQSAEITMEAALERTGGTGKAGELTIAVGPEGDFTGEEISLLTAGRAVPCSLGGLTLRSETAAITACAIASRWAAGHKNH
ncbi:16S rRNA (uracil(1498)-N(3))-methyltransferase [bacterium]|nr:16S rRNA (uracil(1498)-N(3))-methyltransferase [bacterium]